MSPAKKQRLLKSDPNRSRIRRAQYPNADSCFERHLGDAGRDLPDALRGRVVRGSPESRFRQRSLEIRKSAPPARRARVLPRGEESASALTLDPSSVPTLWPPNAILLAGLLLTPVRSWAAVFAATFVAHLGARVGAHLAPQLDGGVPLVVMLSRYASNAAEAFVGAVAFRWLHKDVPRLDTLRETVILLLCAGFLAPLVSSFLDATLNDVALNGWGQADYWTNWRTRFFSSVLSAITIVPLDRDHRRVAFLRARHVPRRTWIEAVVIFSLLLAASWFVFVRARVALDAFPVLVYAPLPAAGGSRRQAGTVGRQYIVSWPMRSWPSGERSRAMDPLSPVRLRITPWRFSCSSSSRRSPSCRSPASPRIEPGRNPRRGRAKSSSTSCSTRRSSDDGTGISPSSGSIGPTSRDGCTAVPLDVPVGLETLRGTRPSRRSSTCSRRRRTTV